MKRFFSYVFPITVTIFIILYPENAIAYAKSAMSLCADVIVPSLFPFFVCSGLLIYSGFAQVLSKFAGPIMRPAFNVGGPGASALVLGILSGYPLGAVTSCQLYESGYLSKTETERLLAFCNNSGPLFILGVVGSAIYSSVKIGIVLYSAHIIATLLVGVLFRFYASDKHVAPEYFVNQKNCSFPEVFATVLANSVNSILTICGAVIFFGVISGIITTHLPADDIIKSVITGILELTGGTKAISNTSLSLTSKLTLSAFIVGFAGICVHIQVASVVAKHHLSLIPYIVGKVLHGLLSAGLTFLYFLFFPPDAQVFNVTSTAMSAGFCMSSIYTMINSTIFAIAGAVTVVFSMFGVSMVRKGAKKGTYGKP